MAFGGVSVGRNRGDIYGGASDLNNPNFQFRRGIVGNDTTVAVKASGTYQFPVGVSTTASFQHATGLPQLTSVLVASNTVTLTQVSQAIAIEPRASVRYRPLNQVDVSVRKRFTFGSIGIEPTLDIYNLTNSGVITTQVTQLGPTYGGARVILDGRMIKLGATLNF